MHIILTLARAIGLYKHTIHVLIGDHAHSAITATAWMITILPGNPTRLAATEETVIANLTLGGWVVDETQ